MNSLLDITGHFLYLALNIILLPVFVALDCFLGIWMAAKFTRKLSTKLYKKARQKNLHYQLVFKKRWVFLRTKFVGVHVNSH
jgi:hypothetical protein